MVRKVGQIIARGDRGCLIRVFSAAITKPISANASIERSTAPFGTRKPTLRGSCANAHGVALSSFRTADN